MTRFNANKFSKRMIQLLMMGGVSSGVLAENPSNSMNINILKKEAEMPKTRDEIPEKDRWNVGAFYTNPDAWKRELSEVQGARQTPYFPQLKSYQGKLKDPVVAAQFFDHYFSVNRKLEKLYVYAHLRLDEDLGNDTFKRDFGLISTLIHAFQQEVSWVEPEILALQDEEYHSLLEASSLKQYRFYLEKLGRMRPHTLSPEMEELLALSGNALDGSRKAFGALNNADLSFAPAVDSKGVNHPLSNGSYLTYLRSSDRELRRTAFQNLHKGYEAHTNTLCELMQGHVQTHLFIAKARKFNTCLEASLFPLAVDSSVYTNLIATVRKNLPLMHEYIAFRKKQMGLKEIHTYDLYAPLVSEVKMEMSYPEACEVVVASVAPLGKEYQQVLRKGLTQDRWVDVFENHRKRSGAYSSGCYDSMPYILMNFHGNFGDVQTLAHEAGHSMHSYLSRQTQPYIYADYSIFVAEVASTFNELLLLNLMKEKAKDKKELAYLINDELERIRATIFRQTLFAEFELQMHKWAEEGTPFTPALLKQKYLELNRDYYGPDLAYDPELEIEWARIPHFYSNFYVYQYATGLSAAMALNQKALASTEARDRYIEFLSSGGSDYPIHLLQKAGVDMTSSEPVDAALKRFKDLLDQLRAIL